jgi:hypothetical protein
MQKDKAWPSLVIDCVVYMVIMLRVTFVRENDAEISGMGALMCTLGGQERHSTVTDELIQKVDQHVCGKCCFTISEPSEEFPQTSRTTLYRIVMDRLGYHKFCAWQVPKQLTGFHKTQRMGSALMFLQHYWEEGDQFLDNHDW